MLQCFYVKKKEIHYVKKDYYYYYYNYKLAPEETTSKLLDKVTFNPLINATASCSDTVVDGVLRRTCNSSGAGYDGATYKLKFEDADGGLHTELSKRGSQRLKYEGNQADVYNNVCKIIDSKK